MAEKKGAEAVAMAVEGTQYSDPFGRFSLSWPLGGEREIVKIPHDERGGGLEARIIGGSVVEVTDKPNRKLDSVRASVTVLTGQAAKAHMRKPPPEDGVQFRSFRIHEEATEEDKTPPGGVSLEQAQKLMETDTPPASGEDGGGLIDVDHLDDITRKELDQMAEAEGIDTKGLRTKADVASAINAKRQEATAGGSTGGEQVHAGEVTNTVGEGEANPAEGEGQAEDEGE